MELYHGTNNNFENFDSSFLGLNYNDDASKSGFFFTNDREEAENYGEIVKTVNIKTDKILNITSSLISKCVAEWLSDLEDSDPEEYEFQTSTKQYENSQEINKGAELAILEAKNRGYYGAKIIDEEFDTETYVIFNTENIN